jgi:hypothetical protein
MIPKLIGACTRGLLLLMAVLGAVSLAISRANPEGPSRRVRSTSSELVLDSSLTVFHGDAVHSVDPQTGRLGTLSLPGGLRVDRASLSPWGDEGGRRRQVVGIGWSRSGSGYDARRTGIGLVRLGLPDGEVLDHWTLPDLALPSSPPCWVPGTRAGILYAGNDFRLYRADFERDGIEGDGDRDGGVARCPWRVRWDGRTMFDGARDVQFLDPSWTEEGRVVVSLRLRDAATGRLARIFHPRMRQVMARRPYSL